MSMWGEVVGSLRAMTLWQLLFAFLACIGYALVQGRLVGLRTRAIVLAFTGVAALAFVLEGERWVDGFMLIVMALAGMGVFAALVWLASRVLGLTTTGAPRPVDSLISLPPGAGDAPGHASALPTAPRAAPSH